MTQTKTINTKVANLRVEQRNGAILFDWGRGERMEMPRHLIARLLFHLLPKLPQVATWMVTLQPTMIVQNLNYQLSRYNEATVARLTINSDEQQITGIEFLEPGNIKEEGESN